jgi:hypothetical protein
VQKMIDEPGHVIFKIEHWPISSRTIIHTTLPISMR